MNQRQSNSVRVIQLGNDRSFIKRVFRINHKKVVESVNSKLMDILKINSIEEAISPREQKYNVQVLWSLFYDKGIYYKNYSPKEISEMIDALNYSNVIKDLLRNNVYLQQSISNKSWL